MEHDIEAASARAQDGATKVAELLEKIQLQESDIADVQKKVSQLPPRKALPSHTQAFQRAQMPDLRTGCLHLIMAKHAFVTPLAGSDVDVKECGAARGGRGELKAAAGNV